MSNNFRNKYGKLKRKHRELCERVTVLETEFAKLSEMLNEMRMTYERPAINYYISAKPKKEDKAKS